MKEFIESSEHLFENPEEELGTIASVRIHVERAIIGRMKQFKMLKGVFPLKMARLANQVITVCALLTNFQGALVPVSPGVCDDNADNDSDDSDIDGL